MKARKRGRARWHNVYLGNKGGHNLSKVSFSTRAKATVASRAFKTLYRIRVRYYLEGASK